MSEGNRWQPSRREQHLKWWAQQVLCYVVGGGGLIYEVLVDHLRNPTALVVFGGIAGVPEVLGYRRNGRRREREDDEEEP